MKRRKTDGQTKKGLDYKNSTSTSYLFCLQEVEAVIFSKRKSVFTNLRFAVLKHSTSFSFV